ncbi:MAG TPA: hypothetical protein VGR50_04650 [Terriglobales bacterium]|nr:hypothetical protein [Terriglobales bacterium]
MVAPLDCAQASLSLIAREAEHAEQGRPARIVAKMNGLTDKAIIQALYRASQAGVEIDLIVRGMCALRPGVRGVSERIRVRSIVGRFLEHSRIFYFANGGEDEIYLGSADWMPRNLYERVEVMFPVKEPLLRQRISQEILDAYLADRVKSRFVQSDGAYVPFSQVTRKRRMLTDAANPMNELPDLNAQEFLLALAEGRRPAQAPVAVTPRRPRLAVSKPLS